MKKYINDRKITLPDFIIIGAGRSGTSSLFYYLSEHDEIFLPDLKEPHFFNFPKKWSLEQYSRLFQDAKEYQIIGEATASYLYYHDKTIKSLKFYYGKDFREVKLIAMLRNPVERAWSYFMLLKRSGKKANFFKFLEDLQKVETNNIYHDFISSGMYYKLLKNFSEEFPYLKIILFDNFVAKPDDTLLDIYQFLGLKDLAYLPDNLGLVYNASGIPKSRFIKTIYNFIFRDNKIKEKIKHTMPIKMRQKIKNKIANIILKKTAIPNDIRIFLQKQFSNDVENLVDLINNPADKDVVKNWI